jgi:predicted O-methyltransferase YrrM
MDRDSAARFIGDVYDGILRRMPGKVELTHWVDVVMGGEPLESVVHKFVTSPEHKELRRVPLAVPPGHFYSPIVDPATVRHYVRQSRDVLPEKIPGVSLDIKEMEYLWTYLSPAIANCPFLNSNEMSRYKHIGDYPPFDAVILYAMIMHYRPERIIEIGSGHSTLSILDAANDAKLPRLSITCIEPHPQRLFALLGNDDLARINLLRCPVQEVDVNIFGGLAKNDILFIDSTHVLKTGSDVHYQLFSILPALKAGVIIHCHDVVYPFEYPDGFIFDVNRSWNEAYAIRAFLMYNRQFDVIFWGSLLAKMQPEMVGSFNPAFLVNPGGSIWLRRLD